MEGVTFRNAGPADGAAMAALFNRCFCDTFAHLYRQEDLDKFLAGSTAARWSEEAGEPGVAVRLAEQGGQPVALAKIGPLSLPADGAPGALELRSLYVLGAWHGTGIARELMEWVLAEAQARRATELYLSVYVDNHRARRFYDRYAFEPAGRYDFMVGNHADEDIIMRLRLGE